MEWEIKEESKFEWLPTYIKKSLFVLHILVLFYGLNQFFLNSHKTLFLKVKL